MCSYADRFIEYLKYEKRFSDHTIVSYSADLAQFTEFLHQHCSILVSADSRQNDIRSWVIHLMDNEYSSSSVNRKLSTLKRFFKYLLAEGIIKNNPASAISALKVKKALPVFIPETRLLPALNSLSSAETFKGVRDLFIIEVLYATGIRLSELLNLKHADFDGFNQQIKVLGKRNKERIIPISDSLIHLYKSYTQKLANEGLNASEFVFVRESGEKMYAKQVYTIVKDYLANLTTQQKKSPHVLRHTFATHMLNNGADLNAIKELLGHASLASTQVYTHNTIEKLKSTYNQAHPKA